MHVVTAYLPEKYPLVDDQIPYEFDVEMEGEKEIDILESEGYYLGPEERFYNIRQVNTNNLLYYLTVDGKEMEVNVYPDTLVWVKDFGYAYNEPLANNYYWHPAYDNYPVVGITYYQALAYCQWLTDRVNMEILVANKVLDKRSWDFSTTAFRKDPKNKEHLHFLLPSFRLPTEQEWIFASQAKLFEFEVEKLDYKSKKYKYNYGAVIDRNFMDVKSYAEDGGFHAIMVKTYQANSHGLYEMQGNVTEWTSTQYVDELSFEQYPALEIPKSLYNYFRLDNNSDTNFIYSKSANLNEIINTYDSLTLVSYFNGKRIPADSLFYRHFHKRLSHNAQIVEARKPLVVVKGGSWASSLIYLVPYSKEVCEPDQARSTIGFRVAL
jgi:formylglycine-generating enzyme required for sulfatase activity